jgi:quercetin dioxygenase-like cupin family protein
MDSSIASGKGRKGWAVQAADIERVFNLGGKMRSFALSVTPWPADQTAAPQAIEAQMKAENLPYYRWSNNPGDVYGVHRHNYHKLIYVLSGSITFELPQTDRSIPLAAGDRLALPAGVDHGAVVGSDGVVCLEAHQAAG